MYWLLWSDYLGGDLIPVDVMQITFAQSAGKPMVTNWRYQAQGADLRYGAADCRCLGLSAEETGYCIYFWG